MVENITSTTLVEDNKPEGVNVEVQSYVEKIEKQSESINTDTSLSSAISNTNVSIVNNTSPVSIPADAVILPATQTTYVSAEKSDLKSSVTWLRKWCEYMIQKYKSRVFFRGE